MAAGGIRSWSAAHGFTKPNGLRVNRLRFIQMLLERRNCLLWKEPSPLWASEAQIEAHDDGRMWWSTLMAILRASSVVDSDINKTS